MPAATLTYRQGWRESLEPGFNPGTVRIEQQGDIIKVEAHLVDDHIVDPDVKLNDHAYNQGDVFELFIMAEGESHYHELHTTPGGVRLQLKFVVGERLDVKKATRWDDFFTVTTERVSDGWKACLTIPVAHISDLKPTPTRWKIACGRYDYRPDGSKILSNTAPLRLCSFHRHHEWPVYDLA